MARDAVVIGGERRQRQRRHVVSFAEQRADAPHEREAVFVRHADVADDDVRLKVFELGASIRGRARRVNDGAAFGENHGERALVRRARRPR